jgi:hypothetical protein
VRRPRATRVQEASRGRIGHHHLPDGPGQQDRDAAFAAGDPLSHNDWIYAYDAEQAAAAEGRASGAGRPDRGAPRCPHRPRGSVERRPIAMKRSIDRICMTQVGSLPRPRPLLDLMRAAAQGHGPAVVTRPGGPMACGRAR